MSRRVDGVLLLVAVLTGSLLLARVDGIRIAGTAVAVPGAGVPSAADCLTEVAGPFVAAASQSPPSPSSVTTVGQSEVSFSDCADQHVGEVVAFRMTPTRASGSVTDQSDSTWCRDVAQGYGPAPAAGWWKRVTTHRFVAILSASTEYSWAACAVVAPGGEQYPGSYVASLAGTSAPAPFGRCRTGDRADRWVSCALPHRVEEFGVAVHSGLSTRGAVAECQELVAEMTGMPDINAGGVLKIQVVGGRTPGTNDLGDADPTGVPEFGRCRLVAVGPHQLTGTVIGIGTGDLPLA